MYVLRQHAGCETVDASPGRIGTDGWYLTGIAGESSTTAGGRQSSAGIGSASVSCSVSASASSASFLALIERDTKESYKQSDPEDTETQDKIDEFDELLADPQVKAALLEKSQG